MKHTIIIPFLITVFIGFNAHAGKMFGNTEFMGDVSAGSWTNVIGGIEVGTSNGGSYTNGGYTNYYRLAGTNILGRIPGSSNIVYSFTGDTNVTNSVTLLWTRYDGVSSFIVEKSLDEGSTWTNWLSLSANTTNWTDTGTNSWTNSVFTNLYSLVPDPTVPWGTTTDVASLQAQIDTNKQGITDNNTNIAAQVVRIGAIEDRTNDWNTAYGWGDHSLAGYFMADGSTVGNISAWGSGMHTGMIDSTCQGAFVRGYNNAGTIHIGEQSHGAGISVWNEAGTVSIGNNSYGAGIYGYSYAGTMQIGDSAGGAVQRGACNAMSSMYIGSIGGGQYGLVWGAGANATNMGYGSLQLFYLQDYEQAVMTGHASIGLGACVVSNNEAFVAGDGEQSHGDGSITAKSFWIGDLLIGDTNGIPVTSLDPSTGSEGQSPVISAGGTVSWGNPTAATTGSVSYVAGPGSTNTAASGIIFAGTGVTVSDNGGTSTVSIATGADVNTTNDLRNGASITNYPFSVTLSYGICSNATNEIVWWGNIQKACVITNISWGCTIGTPVADFYTASNALPFSAYDYISTTGLCFGGNTAPSNLAVSISLAAGQRGGWMATNGVGTNAYIIISGHE